MTQLQRSLIIFIAVYFFIIDDFAVTSEFKKTSLMSFSAAATSSLNKYIYSNRFYTQRSGLCDRSHVSMLM